MKRLLLAVAVACGLRAPTIQAQTAAQAGPVDAAGRAAFDLSIDNVMRGPALYGWEPDQIRWTPDGARLYFSWKQHDDPLEKEHDTYVVNRDGSGLRKLSEQEKKDAMPPGGDRTRDRRRIVYADDGDIFLWDAATGKRRALTQTTEAESSPRFTHDENRVTFIRNNNVFALDLASGELVQLTNAVGPEDKGPNVTMWEEKKGTASQEYVKAEELKLLDVVARRAKKREEDEAKKKREHPLKPFKLAKGEKIDDARLAPDGTHLILAVTTEPEKAKKTIVPNYVTESAYTDTIPGREKVGDVQPSSRIAVMDEANGEVKWFEHGLTVQQPAPKQKPSEEPKPQTPPARDVSMRMPLFSDDGKHAFVVVRSNDNKDLWIMSFDPAAPKGRTIASEHDDAWIRWPEPGLAPGWIDNDTIFYTSEATGSMHLYSVPFNGGKPKALTSGKWEVDAVALAPDKKTFSLTTSEVSPFEKHFFRLPVTGGTPEKLTTTVGDHAAVMSPDGAVIADVYSYANTPPELYVGGKKVTTSPAPDFFNYAWIDPPIVHVPARDGAQVPGHLYLPPHPNGNAVIFVHGAGYLQNISRGWSQYPREYLFHHILMQRGYTVLDLDYRGSAGYGRDWRTAIYRHMGGKDLDDQIDGARWLVKEHGIDPKRIGIYGGSYGGFTTLMAMFTQPDVFAAGAALRPVTDWAHYNHPYTSDILNEPQSDAEAYRRSSPIYFAQGLKGRLLICHGMVDTNVHFQDTVRLVQKLIELRKTNWELAVFPVENHGFVEPTSWADEYRRILRLFDETLR